MSNIPDFFTSQMDDPYARDNFRKLKDFLVIEMPFLGFRFYEVIFTAAASNYKFAHGLGFTPKDIILSSKTTGVTVTFNQDATDTDNITLTVSSGCTIRFLAGTFKEGR